MSLPDGLHMRDATLADLPAIVALRESAGWSAHEWALRFVLTAPEARCVVVEDAGGEIVGVGSGVGYGPLGVVGNMIVAEEHRRRGVGRAVLDAVMDDLHARGARRLELYATVEGRPLYERAGFGFIEPGSRAEVARSAPLAPDSALTVEEQAADATEIAGYDAPRYGGDRSSLLAFMTADPSRPMLVARRDGTIVGFAWLRTDGDRLGPFLADAPRVAATLMAAAFERLPKAADLTINLPMSNSDGVGWLRSLGVEPDPWDGRMALGPRLAQRESTIYSNALGALG
jgi:GNAT superfamily N-acetyltransferase